MSASTSPFRNPSTASSVVLSDVSFAWPDGTAVFDHLDLTLNAGTYSLIGANGAGKSTLLALLAGRLEPASGSITLSAGADAEVGLVTQDPQSDPRATVDAALGIADVRSALRRIENGSVDPDDFEIVGDEWDVEERALAMLAQMGLPPDLDRAVGSMSGGEATLLSIVAALMRRPSLLLLDEPNIPEAHSVRTHSYYRCAMRSSRTQMLRRPWCSRSRELISRISTTAGGL